MKFTLITVLALFSVAYGKNLDLEDNLEDNSAYGYLTNVGKRLAKEVKAAEEKNSQLKIVGGSASSLGQFPYQAGLIIYLAQGQAVCGGSLLNNRRVLTAAHCWWDGQNQARWVTVVLGSITLFTGGTRLSTSDVVMHGSWNPRFVRNDIAMIRLPSNISFSSTIGPIALPSGSEINENFANNTAIASGFGFTHDKDRITLDQFLTHVDVDVITNAVCTMSFPIIIRSSNICISGANGRSTCYGDSGGPLVVERNNTRILIGVTSFGSERGCQIESPVAFARVTYFLSWINSNL